MNKKVNYKKIHHEDMIKATFRKQENVRDYALKHLEELERFNEQLSDIM